MPRIIPFFLSLLFTFSALFVSPVSPALAAIDGLVIRVSDGDTVVLRVGNQDERVRLIGIDAPEKAQIPWGPRAKEFTKKLALGKKARLETDVQPRDKYGRMLGYLFVGKTFVNLELVKNGYAMLYTYPPNVKYTAQFVAAQKEARSKGLNIWAPNGGLDQTPYEFRHKGKTPPPDRGQSGLRSQAAPQTKTEWVGSRKAKKVHRADCPWAEKISEGNRVYFQSREEAEQAGFKPCRSCLN